MLYCSIKIHWLSSQVIKINTPKLKSLKAKNIKTYNFKARLITHKVNSELLDEFVNLYLLRKHFHHFIKQTIIGLQQFFYLQIKILFFQSQNTIQNLFRCMFGGIINLRNIRLPLQWKISRLLCTMENKIPEVLKYFPKSANKNCKTFVRSADCQKQVLEEKNFRF